ncbi:MAG: trehalose-phosphatase [Pseudomonadota bacterium]
MNQRLEAPPSTSLSETALFFDVDGTLVALEEKPEAVVVSKSLRMLLERLIIATDGALALVSGRSIAQLDSLFKPLEFSASGVHGLERRLLPGRSHRIIEATGALDDARAELDAFTKAHPGTLFEDKGLTLALHYRMAAEHREEAASLVRKLVSADPEKLVLLEGKMVFELKPPGFDKGRAIADFMKEPPFRGRSPIFAGDDVTDEAGFRTINQMDGVAIKVGIDDRPTEATFGVDNVESMLRWLEGLVDDTSKRDAGEGQ